MEEMKEYDILKKIPFHKNIIPLHNLYLFNRANARVIPVLQYELAETSLDNEISKKKGPDNKYSHSECLKIMTDLAEGLSYLHSN